MPDSVQPPAKIYLRALLLRDLSDVETVKHEVNAGNVLILRISALAERSVEDVKRAVDDLCHFTELIGGDIARLGEERVVVTPSSIRIWRGESILKEGGTPTEAG
ncbi:MAG: cell division protein SepF [Candidatus Bathyarchaeota archaeon]|nr:MAG: cell division protein SepF [Candidatus Bathyarchaeota archaeon]